MDLIPLFPVRTVRNDPIVGSAVLFAACTVMGACREESTAHSSTSSP